MADYYICKAGSASEPAIKINKKGYRGNGSHEVKEPQNNKHQYHITHE